MSVLGLVCSEMGAASLCRKAAANTSSSKVQLFREKAFMLAEAPSALRGFVNAEMFLTKYHAA